ncbi:MAG: cytochrome c [Magnetospirillum sp. WYHS-4]
MRKFAIAAALLLAGQAQAHGPMAPAYGGQVVEVGNAWRIEFAVRDGGIRVWLRDHSDVAVPPARLAGKATLLAGGRRLDLALAPDKEFLKADADVKAAERLAAVVTLVVEGQAVAARFEQPQLAMPALGPATQAGKAVFDQICAACHGTSLRGTDNGPPLLHPFYAPGHHDDAMMVAAINVGAKSHHWKFGDMPKPEGVKPGQDKALVAYIRAVQAVNGIAPTPAMTGAGGHAGH